MTVLKQQIGNKVISFKQDRQTLCQSKGMSYGSFDQRKVVYKNSSSSLALRLYTKYLILAISSTATVHQRFNF